MVTARRSPGDRSAAERAMWALAGGVCVLVGAIGIVVPGLPTTIFFIGAAAAFSRSSERLEAWVLSLPKVGPAIDDYRAGLGMPQRAKVVAVAMITIAVTLSVVLAGIGWVSALVVAAGVVGIVAVLRVPTRRPRSDE